jgi:probable addiction module antidote protein
MNKKDLLNTFPNFDDFLLEELKDPEKAKEYLNALFEEYLEDGNKELFLYGLKPLIQAKGSISDFSEKIGMNRTYLYKIFNNKVSPDFNTIIKILNALGFELSISIKKSA